MKRALWRVAALGLVATFSYQLGLHIFAFLINLGRADDGAVHLGIVLGAPIALGYGVLVTAIVWSWFGDNQVPSRTVSAAGLYVLALVGSFIIVGSSTDGLRETIYRLGLVVAYSVIGIARLPWSAGMYVGYPAAHAFLLVAMGVPSVGPILFLAWRGRRCAPREAT